MTYHPPARQLAFPSEGLFHLRLQWHEGSPCSVPVHPSYQKPGTFTTTHCGSATLCHGLHALLLSFCSRSSKISSFQRDCEVSASKLECARHAHRYVYLDVSRLNISWKFESRSELKSSLSFFIECCDPDRMTMGDNCCQGWRPQMLYSEGAIVLLLIFFVSLPLLLCSTLENVNVLARKRSWV